MTAECNVFNFPGSTSFFKLNDCIMTGKQFRKEQGIFRIPPGQRWFVEMELMWEVTIDWKIRTIQLQCERIWCWQVINISCSPGIPRNVLFFLPRKTCRYECFVLVKCFHSERNKLHLLSGWKIIGFSMLQGLIFNLSRDWINIKGTNIVIVVSTFLSWKQTTICVGTAYFLAFLPNYWY